jgi:hypothetical protein
VQLSGIAGGSASIDPANGTFTIYAYTFGPFPGQATVTSAGYGQTAQASIVAHN